MVEAPILTRLAHETEVHHAEADADIDRFLFTPRPTAEDYRNYLARVYGFLAPLEGALAVTPGLDRIIDVRARAKAAFVARDLVALGASLPLIGRLPICLSVPAFRGAAAALGWLYTAERPMLAAAMIRRHLSTQLPVEIDQASAYLGCYDGVVSTRWRDLGNAMQRIAATEVIADRIVDAAREAFRAQRRWRMTDLDQVRLAV
jgi:heme oxygenase